MTPMGSRDALIRRRRLSGATGLLLVADAAERARERPHLVVAQQLRERVGDPVDGVGGPPGDQAQPAAVVELLVGAPAHVDLVGRVVQDRRRLPGRPLDPVVLAVLTGVADDAVGAVAMVTTVVDVVHARVGRGRRRRGVAAERELGARVVQREAQAHRRLGDQVLPGDAGVDHARRQARGRLLRRLALARGGLLRGLAGLARAVGGLRVEELILGDLEVLGRDRDVRLAGIAAGMDLADRVARRVERQPEQAEYRLRIVLGYVGLGVAPEDPQELLAVAEDPTQADLVLRLAQEVLLARGADEVVVGVAVAHGVPRPPAAQLLVARR